MRFAILSLVLTGTLTAQQQRPSRSGPRTPLDRSDEIALARSAAPPSVTDSARVLVFAGDHFVVADSGSNGVACIVSRPWSMGLEPHCYDREAAETVMPIEMRRNELWRRGASDEEIERDIGAGIATGRYRLPRRPAMTYMMSAAQLLFDNSGAPLGKAPHLMIYYPYLSNRDLGLPTTPDMHVGLVDEDGTAMSTLIILMSTSVPVRGARH